MSFIAKGGGVTTLSGLTIDVDKDWQAKGISNLKELALGMVQGDLIVRGPAVLQRFPPGIANTMLTSAGPGVIPFWGPGGLYLNRYFPAVIGLSTTVVKETPDKTDSEPAPISSVHVETCGDLPASGIKQLTPTVALTDAEAIEVADRTDDEPAPVHTHFDLEKVVDGAVAEAPVTVFATETAGAQSAAANDMTLLAAIPALNDAYYFGFNYLWDNLLLNIGTAGAGGWALTWEYYDADTTWHALAGVTDGTLDFKAAAGIRTVVFTRPAGWALTNVNLAGNMYWIRARVTGIGAIVTQPKGTQAWCRIIT